MGGLEKGREEEKGAQKEAKGKEEKGEGERRGSREQEGRGVWQALARGAGLGLSCTSSHV